MLNSSGRLNVNQGKISARWYLVKAVSNSGLGCGPTASGVISAIFTPGMSANLDCTAARHLSALAFSSSVEYGK